jgi:hypothetical protein
MIYSTAELMLQAIVDDCIYLDDAAFNAQLEDTSDIVIKPHQPVVRVPVAAAAAAAQRSSGAAASEKARADHRQPHTHTARPRSPRTQPDAADPC